MKRLDEILARCEAAIECFEDMYEKAHSLSDAEFRSINKTREDFAGHISQFPLVVEALKYAIRNIKIMAHAGIPLAVLTLAEISLLLGEPPVQSPQGSEGEEK
jgi:hypothetical protein